MYKPWYTWEEYSSHVRLLKSYGWYCNQADGFTDPTRTYYLTEKQIRSMSLEELDTILLGYHIEVYYGQ